MGAVPVLQACFHLLALLLTSYLELNSPFSEVCSKAVIHQPLLVPMDLVKGADGEMLEPILVALQPPWHSGFLMSVHVGASLD